MYPIRSHLRSIATTVPLLAFRATGGAIPILVGLLIARQWGLEELAAFTLAQASITISMVIADWGATRALPRNLAKLPPEGAARFLASANGVRLILTLGVLAVVIAAAVFRLIDPGVAHYLVVLYPVCPLFGITTSAISERVVVKETGAVTFAVIGGLVVFAILGAGVMTLHLGPYWFVGAFVAGKVVEAALIASGRWWVLSARTTDLSVTAIALWPFSLQAIVAVIYARAPVYTVEHMTSRMELGVFSVAAGLQNGLLLIAASTAMTTFPELTKREHEGDRRGVRHLLTRYVAIALAGTSVAILMLAVLIRPITAVLKLPQNFNTFIVAHAAVSMLAVFSTMASFIMQARGEESRAARLSLIALVLAVGYQLVALRALGLWGIVVATVGSELTLTAIFAVALRRKKNGRP